MPRLANPKQERFCRHYITHWKKAQAAEEAGYSPKSAANMATKLLKDSRVKKRIRELTEHIDKKLMNDVEMIRDNLRLMATVEITDIFNDDLTMKKLSEMSKGARLLIAGIEVKKDMLGPVQVAEILKIKNLDKLKAIELLGKHKEVSAFEENVNVNEGEDRGERMRRWQKRMGLRGKPDPEDEVDEEP